MSRAGTPRRPPMAKPEIFDASGADMKPFRMHVSGESLHESTLVESRFFQDLLFI